MEIEYTMQPHFKDYFNPFEYWFIDLKRNRVSARNFERPLSTFVNEVHKGYKLILPAEIIKFNSLMRERSLNYQY